MRLWEKVACVVAFSVVLFSDEIGDFFDRKFPL